jgi:hypothetical protein
MFFRREKPRPVTFEERIENLKKFGFQSRREASGSVCVLRDGCAAMVEDAGGGKVSIGKAGVVADGQIAGLVHAGYQLFWRTPGGRELPALAEQLKALHAFEEDLREGLGLTSLYNVSLGTVCDDHLYDRVENRDEPQHYRPWETKKTA